MRGLKIIAGLGNPGSKYENTRHNAGFDTVDIMAEKLGVKVDSKKFGSLIARARFADSDLFLIKPQQYMNNSGQAAATVTGFYKASPSQLLVITDDLALGPGKIRLREKGSAGGHNGLKDIIEKLGTDQFARLRIGVGPAEERDTKGYVLSRPFGEEKELIEKALERAAEAAFCWLEHGAEKAMSKFNG